jgi:hypothetical protein
VEKPQKKDPFFSKASMSVEEFPIPKALLGSIVGPNRQRLTDLERQTGCRVNINALESTLLITGDNHARTTAKALLAKWVHEAYKNRQTEHMIIPASIVAGIIGEDGCRIMQIERQTGVKCALIPDANNNGLQLLAVTGDVDSREQALRMVDGARYELLQTRGTCQMVIPVHCVSAMIGKNGCVIRDFRRRSGALCSIDQTATGACHLFPVLT